MFADLCLLRGFLGKIYKGVKMLNKAVQFPADAIGNISSVGADQFDNLANSARQLQDKIFPIFDFKKPQQTKAHQPKIEISNQNVRSEIKVFSTKDPELLNQYYELRHKAYCIENGWKDYQADESEFDRKARILVAMNGQELVGGARLMFSDECEFLSNEILGTEFTYKSLIKKYDERENLIIGEFSSLAAKKGYRDTNTVTKIFSAIAAESKIHGCNYVFGVAVALVCRNDRKIAKRLGYDLEIVMSRPWPERSYHNFTKAFPVYAKLQ
jgi:N-acyl-L-homoserine lactone synthetase